MTNNQLQTHGVNMPRINFRQVPSEKLIQMIKYPDQWPLPEVLGAEHELRRRSGRPLTAFESVQTPIYNWKVVFTTFGSVAMASAGLFLGTVFILGSAALLAVGALGLL